MTQFFLPRSAQLAAVLALVVLASCGAPPPPVTELTLDAEVPDTYTRDQRDSAVAAADTVMGATWWTDFAEPDLDALITEALVRNHDLQAAAYRVQQAVALAGIAGADLYPQLNLDAGAARTRQNFVGLPIPGSGDEVLTSESTRFNLGLALSWELDLWGRIRAGKSAALANVQASYADYQGARLSVASLTAKAWIQPISARLVVDLAEDTVESFERTANQVRERYQRGLRTSLDLRLALTRSANARAALAGAKRLEENASRRLELLLGRYPGADLMAARDLPETPGAAPLGLPADLLSRRPDLAAIERRVAAGGMRVKEAKAALYPRISLTASGGTSSSELSDLINGDFFVWNLAANLMQPIFQGGRLRQNVKLNQARAAETAEQYAGVVLNAYAEVENALAADLYYEQEVGFIREAARQARAAESTANLQYQAGIADFITVLESQRQAIQAEVDLIASRAGRLAARVDLYVALGGGFTSDPETASGEGATPDPENHTHTGS